MKVTLDLARLLREGKITPAEFDKLKALGARDAGSLAINILIGFGVVAVAGGALALVPTPEAAIALGGLILALGVGLLMLDARWVVLANICILVGALMFGGGTVKLGEGSAASVLTVAAVFAVAGVIARNGLLMVGTVLALSSAIGVRTGYFHATYMLGIQEPAATVVLFSVMALAAFLASKRLSDPYDRLALMVARTSVFLVNFGFWIGSLWGDRMVWVRRLFDPAVVESYREPVVIGRIPFAIGWAVALLAVGVWGALAGRRWVLNVVAVFAGIHFYTQWFERLAVTPGSVMVAGLLILAFAFGLWQLNRRFDKPA